MTVEPSGERPTHGEAGQFTLPLLSPSAHVLVVLASNPRMSLEEIAAAIGKTKRQTQDYITDLCAAGYLDRTRPDRRNHYTVRLDAPLPDPNVHATVGELLRALA